MNSALLSVRDLRVYYKAQGRVIKAVDGVTFELNRGETLGLVGESGCGKTTVGRALASLLQPQGGEILWEGKDGRSLSGSERDALFRRRQIVFQDPYASLNPLWRVRDLVAEPIRIHRLLSGDALNRRVKDLLKLVGMDERFAGRYPSELSGGQRQRVAIARALSTDPEVLILDEPTAALDISVRAQILNLLLDLRQQQGLSMLLITHDFSVVQSLANRIAVMYLGRVVETAETSQLLEDPRHPYTQMLIRSVLPPRPTGMLPDIPPGEVPDLFHLPSGCRFRARCPKAVEACAASEPELDAWQEGNHNAACFRVQV